MPLSGREGYFSLKPKKEDVASFIAKENSFVHQQSYFEQSITDWSNEVRPSMLNLGIDINPKEMIEKWAQILQDAMQKDESLVDAYDAYQQLMTYWNDTLQDDCYMISRDGWKLTLLKGDKKNSTYEDMSCDLLPVNIVLQEFFSAEIDTISTLLATSETYVSQLQELLDKAKEEIGEEDEEELKRIIDEVKKTPEYKAIDKKKKEVDKEIKEKKQALTLLIETKYATLAEDETKILVVDKKWLATIFSMVHREMQEITYQLTSKIIVIVERYEQTLTDMVKEVGEYETKVIEHLQKMGFEF